MCFCVSINQEFVEGGVLPHKTSMLVAELGGVRQFLSGAFDKQRTELHQPECDR